MPYIVILCDPTTGGVSASLAMLGDIHISEPGAVIGFAGQRVIEQTIRETLPEGFQRAEYLLEHGMIDMVVPRKNLQAELAKVIDLLMVTIKATKPMTVTTKTPAIVEAEILLPVTVTNADIKSDADSIKDGIESRDESKK